MGREFWLGNKHIRRFFIFLLHRPRSPVSTHATQQHNTMHTSTWRPTHLAPRAAARRAGRACRPAAAVAPSSAQGDGEAQEAECVGG